MLAASHTFISFPVLLLFLNACFTSTYLTLLLPHAGAHASHAGSGSAGPGDQHGELAEPPLPPSLWQELRTPRLMMVKTEVTTSFHFHFKTPNAYCTWIQPSAHTKPHNLTPILSFSEWHKCLEWQTAYQFTTDVTFFSFLKGHKRLLLQGLSKVHLHLNFWTLSFFGLCTLSYVFWCWYFLMASLLFLFLSSVILSHQHSRKPQKPAKALSESGSYNVIFLTLSDVSFKSSQTGLKSAVFPS